MGRFDERAGLSRHRRDLTENDCDAGAAPVDFAKDAAGEARLRWHDGREWHDMPLMRGRSGAHGGNGGDMPVSPVAPQYSGFRRIGNRPVRRKIALWKRISYWVVVGSVCVTSVYSAVVGLISFAQLLGRFFL